MNLRQATIKGVPFTTEGAQSRIVTAKQLRAVLSNEWQTGSRHSGQIGPVRGRDASGILRSPRTTRVEIDGGKQRAITLEADDDGIIDLSRLAGRSDGSLPTLILRNCHVEGELRVAGSHFSLLHMDNCIVTAIDARDCRIRGDCQLKRLRVTGCLDLSGARIAGTVRVFRVEAARIALRRARVNGSVHLSDLLFTDNDVSEGSASRTILTGSAPSLDLRGATSTDAVHLRELKLGRAASPASSDGVPAFFDLRNMTCRTFADDDANAWTGLGSRFRWRLLLDGISFEGLDRSDGLVNETDLSAVRTCQESALHSSRRRLAMLTAFAPPFEGAGRYEKLVRTPTYTAQPFAVFAQAYTRSEQRGLATEIATEQIRLRWAAASLIIKRRIRQNWLPAAVAWLSVSIVWSAISNFELHDILRAGASMAQWSSFAKLSVSMAAAGMAVLWFSHRAVLVIGLVFDRVFAFGLRPQRAVFALTLYLLVGIGLTQVAADRGALLLSADIGAVRTHGSPLPATGAPSSDRTVEVLHQISAESCNQATQNRIDQFVYAIDVIVPVDLRQECSFSFAPENGPGWRLGKTIYALVGWVVISLALLSLSGVLRRDIEA